jgi:DNA (cytosine-5)-methyltransferase 1
VSEELELIVDSFAGGGGASTGIEMALGRSPDIAINHNAEALAMHLANHPSSRHLSKNIWKIDPLDEIGRRKVGLAWFSPDCKHFSKAKGGKPVKRNIRDLAWIVVLWAERVRPRIICLENVEEFQDWGPLLIRADGSEYPCPDRKGETFKRFIRQLKKLGYRVEWKELRACDYGAPTIRKRLFLIARCDGQPIVWPAPTHGPGRPLPYRTAAECIDWTIPCPSIFLTREEGRAIGVNRPLAEATMARIAKGVKRYVIDAAEPFIVPVTHAGSVRCNPISEPLRTVTTAHRGEHALVTPFLVPRYGERPGQEPRTRSVDEPMATIVPTGNEGSLAAVHLTKFSENSIGSRPDEPLHTAMAGAPRHGIVAAFLAQHNAGPRPGQPGRKLDEPVSTITAAGSPQAVVAAHMLNLKGSDRRDGRADAPAPSVTAGGNHVAEVRAFLHKYYGTDQDPELREPLHTVTTKDRFGLVMVHGEPYEIVDIGMRMLTPRELFRAQGFPEGYLIDPEFNGKPLTKTAQIRMCGNSVAPPVAAAIVKANYAPAISESEAA